MILFRHDDSFMKIIRGRMTWRAEKRRKSLRWRLDTAIFATFCSHVSQFQRSAPNQHQPPIMMSLQRIGRSAKTPINQALARQAKSAFSTATLNLSSTLVNNKPKTVNIYPIQIRSLSLQALDMAAVRQIKAELMEVDANGNSDGRYAKDDSSLKMKYLFKTDVDSSFL